MLARLLDWLLGWLPDDFFDVDLTEDDDPAVVGADMWDVWLQRLCEDET